MKYSKIKKENEKGGISVLVLFTILTIMVILMGAFISVATLRKSQLKSDIQIQQIYRRDVEQVDTIYEQLLLKVPEDWEDNVKEIVNQVPIPYGFYYVGGTLDTGVIISDNNLDEGKGETWEISKTLQGNQYVWIPVELEDTESFETKYPRKDGYYNGSMQDYVSSQTATEPYDLGYDTEEDDYKSMIQSVNKYKGFFVGRYEAGCETQRNDTNKETEQNVVSKQGTYIYNYVTWGAAMNSIENYNGTKGAVKLAKEVQEDYDYTSVKSNLMYGIQWDKMLNYLEDDTHDIQDSRSWGNYNDSTGDANTDCGYVNMNYTTGRNKAWCAKNIYDVAGNVYEWTMEAYSSSCRIPRAGYSQHSGNAAPASLRGTFGPIDYSKEIGFRVMLYLN